MAFGSSRLTPEAMSRWRRRKWINFGVQCICCAIAMPVLVSILPSLFFNTPGPMEKFLGYVAAPIGFGLAGILSIRKAMQYRL